MTPELGYYIDRFYGDQNIRGALHLHASEWSIVYGDLTERGMDLESVSVVLVEPMDGGKKKNCFLVDRLGFPSPELIISPSLESPLGRAFTDSVSRLSLKVTTSETRHGAKIAVRLEVENRQVGEGLGFREVRLWNGKRNNFERMNAFDDSKRKKIPCGIILLPKLEEDKAVLCIVPISAICEDSGIEVLRRFFGAW